MERHQDVVLEQRIRAGAVVAGRRIERGKRRRRADHHKKKKAHTTKSVSITHCIIGSSPSLRNFTTTATT